jgi:tripartite ATP-independent transporter DctP family solute receptor
MRAILLLLAALALAVPASAHAAETVIILAHSNVNDRGDNPTAAMAVTFKQRVEADSNHAIKVEIFPENQLGTDAKAVALVRKGVIQMAISSVGGIAPLYPLIGVMDFPFAYRRVEEAYAVLDGPFGQRLRADIEAGTGLAILGFGDTGGLFVLTNSKRPVLGPADMAGLRIRTMNVEAHKLLVRSLGAEPVAIAWNHVYDALQTGLADGQMNSVATTRYGRLQVVQKYMTVTNHLYVPFLWTANRDFLAGLSDGQRAIVAAAVADGVQASRALAAANADSRLAQLLPSVQIHRPTDSELDAFRRATQPPMTAFVARTFGGEGSRLLADFLAAIQQARLQLRAQGRE